MSPDDDLTARFEAERPRLRQVAFRMLGSLDEADDAVQQAWLRAQRSGLREVDNPAGWLTTVTGRICLDVLRARRRRAERPLDPATTGMTAAAATAATAGSRSTAGPLGPAVDAPAGGGLPEAEAETAESVGLALLVVLDRLSPAQRVAFVLHDLFAVPFEEIAPVVGRSPVATKKLASRARARVRGVTTVAAPDRDQHRAVVRAFLAAARGGDLDTLMHLLAPEVVRRSDLVAVPPSTPAEVRGARAVAEETKVFAARARTSAVALVDGAPGIVVAPAGRLLAVLRVAVVDGRVTEIEVVADPARLERIALAVGDPQG